MPTELKIRAEYQNHGGYDCMYDAIDLRDDDCRTVTSVDLKDFGQAPCDYAIEEQARQMFPKAFRYAALFEAAPELAQLLLESREYIGGDWRDRRDSVLSRIGLVK